MATGGMEEGWEETSNKDDLIANFQAITSITDVGEAMAFLESSNWDLNAAVNGALAVQSGADESINMDAQADMLDDIAWVPNPTPMSESPVFGQPPSINPWQVLIDGSATVDPTDVMAPAAVECEKEASSSLGKESRRKTDRRRRGSAGGGSSKNDDKNVLEFIVLDESADRINCQRHTYHMSISKTVRDLRTTINSDIGGRRLADFELYGWPNDDVTDTTQLSDLPLTSPVYLRWRRVGADGVGPSTRSPLRTIAGTSSAGAAAASSASGAAALSTPEKLSKKYKLRIQTDTREEPYVWEMEGSETVDKVKQNVHSITDVPKRRQEWTGWPENTDDDSVLAALGLDQPHHSLTVTTKSVNETNGAASRSRAVGPARTRYADPTVSANQSDEEDEDDDEVDDFDTLAAHGHMDTDVIMDATNSMASSNRLPLIPDECESVDEAMQNFVMVFESRYGAIHPQFAACSLQLAIAQSIDLPESSERRPLLVYLHNDNSIASNVFCTQVICDPPIVQLVDAQFTLWGWDVTYPSNKTKLYEWTEMLGLDPAHAFFRSVPVDQYPLLLVLQKERGQIQLITLIKGTQTSSQVMETLLDATATFAVTVQDAVAEQRERELREQMRVEQQSAYAQALAADKAKAEQQAKQIEEEQALEQIRQQEAQDEESRRAGLLASLPAEPAETESDVVQIRLRCPGGAMEQRRFGRKEKVDWLLTWAHGLGYAPEKYKLFTSDRPRRNVEELDTSKSFADLGIPKREQITIEEK